MARMNNEKPTSAEGLSTSEGVWYEPLAHESIVLTSVNQRGVIVRYTELHIHK